MHLNARSQRFQKALCRSSFHSTQSAASSLSQQPDLNSRAGCWNARIKAQSLPLSASAAKPAGAAPIAPSATLLPPRACSIGSLLSRCIARVHASSIIDYGPSAFLWPESGYEKKVVLVFLWQKRPTALHHRGPPYSGYTALFSRVFCGESSNKIFDPGNVLKFVRVHCCH